MRTVKENNDDDKRTRICIKALLCLGSILVLLFASIRSIHNNEEYLKLTEKELTNIELNLPQTVSDNKGNNENNEVAEPVKVCTDLIRVVIQSGNYAGYYHDSVTLSCDTAFKIVYSTGADNSLLQFSVSGGDISANESGTSMVKEIYGAKEQVTITAESSYFKNDNGVNRIYVIPDEQSGRVSLNSIERSQGTPAYRGIIEIRLTKDGLVVINELLLEEYLYAVVPSEMPANYPLEALKAQAICARTYAYANIYAPGLPQFDAHVDDSTGFQVYNNITEQEATTIAVNETTGKVLFTGNALANTYYYSTSCGFGSDEHVWKSQEPVELTHITSKPINNLEAGQTECVSGGDIGADISANETETVANERKFTAENMCEEAVFSEFILNLHANDFEKDEPWYRWKYDVTEIDVTRILQILQSRYVANPQLVLLLQDNSYISCEPEKLGEIRSISIIKRNAGGVTDELIIEGSEATYKVISELFIRYVLCDGKTRVCRQDGTMVDMSSLLPSGFFSIEEIKDGEKLTGYSLNGGGFGHGAGMSQNGAKNMALSGYSAKQILEFFFTNCDVR